MEPTGETRKPKITVTGDLETIIANVLAKEGWYGGNPLTVFASPVDIVLHSYHYEIFTREYQSSYNELNKVQK